MKSLALFTTIVCCLLLQQCGTAPQQQSPTTASNDSVATFELIPSDTFHFNSFVDCNMATVWIKDTFRIFPGKYGEDPLWGEAHDLKFASGASVDEVFLKKSEEFIEPAMPKNTAPGTPGLHGAVWFETLYKDSSDPSHKTLYALYHNENYPSTLPYDSSTGEGYMDKNWPQGLRGPETPAAVCRIGIMKSTDGGWSWQDKGIILQDHQPRMILKPHNKGISFAGGVGDPSAVANGGYLYIFYGEYGYPGAYDSARYDSVTEWSGQCISVARIAISDLDDPAGKAKRWDGSGFNAAGDGIGKPVPSIQVPREDGGAPASSANPVYHWGPSVSWNEYLNCWVMLMAKAEGPYWKGGGIYISFNRNADLGAGNNSQQWTKPRLLLNIPTSVVWYPSLQPINTPEERAKKFTSLRLGQKARLFFKEQDGKTAPYHSFYVVNFKKIGE
jgi:hypothetical protein